MSNEEIVEKLNKGNVAIIATNEGLYINGKKYEIQATLCGIINQLVKNNGFSKKEIQNTVDIALLDDEEIEKKVKERIRKVKEELKEFKDMIKSVEDII